MKKISIFGKSTVDASESGFQLIKELAFNLVSNGFTCIHGGYAGGIMEAVSLGVHDACQKNQKDETKFNIGVPETRFDEHWPRVEHAFFTEAATDIFERLKMVTNSDLYVVAPWGGDGTLLEADIVIHENTINQLLGKPTKHIVFIEGIDKKWSNLFQARLNNLDISKREMVDYPWVHFIQIGVNFDPNTLAKEITQKIQQLF